jgi:hypothetical protein
MSEKKLSLHDQIKEPQFWYRIHQAAKSDTTIQEALNRVKVAYYLTADYDKYYGNRKNTKT